MALRHRGKGRAMAKGPQGRKRPHDVVSNAIKFMQITIGEAEFEDDGKDAATKAPGAKGDKARAANPPLNSGVRSLVRLLRSSGLAIP